MDDFENFSQRTVHRLFFDLDVELRRGKPCAMHRPRRDPEGAFGQSEAGKLGLERLEGETGIEECAKDHVAAGAREAIEVGDASHLASSLTMGKRVDQRGAVAGPEAVINIHDRDAGGAAIHHCQQRRQALEISAISH